MILISWIYFIHSTGISFVKTKYSNNSALQKYGKIKNVQSAPLVIEKFNLNILKSKQESMNFIFHR